MCISLRFLVAVLYQWNYWITATAFHSGRPCFEDSDCNSVFYYYCCDDKYCCDEMEYDDEDNISPTWIVIACCGGVTLGAFLCCLACWYKGSNARSNRRTNTTWQAQQRTVNVVISQGEQRNGSLPGFAGRIDSLPPTYSSATNGDKEYEPPPPYTPRQDC